ncbi:sensor histidine kinase [Lapidilactobacillus wuchangensis]|uniref:sensor histidine kinase n=1 Tax=Lapidilactobacillus wuchangensis TaxID=2486001 RepID=UPI000F7937F5|nr:HAMP domain-containing sensor histidine kinase [Lapidilactobacillus wuchangensis]
MIIILIILGLINLILLGGLLMIVFDLKRIISDLNYINQHQTNAFVTTSTNLPFIRRLIEVINTNLTKLQTTQRTINHQEKKMHQLLMNLIHDLKTPLAVAMGYGQLLARQTTSSNQPTINRITTNLKAVNYYIQHLTDFNLIQAQAAQLQLQTCHLSQLLTSELLNFYDELTAKQITVDLQIAPNIDWTIDVTLLKRIIQNLVSNWLKYATKTATVKLATVDQQHIELSFSNQTDTIIERPELLTERFYTSDTAHTYQSTGLGLNIVQSLTTTLGGKMLLTTDPQQFQVQLQFHRLDPQ